MGKIKFFRNPKLWNRVIILYLITLAVFLITFFAIPLYNVANYRTLVPQFDLFDTIMIVIASVQLIISARLVVVFLRIKRRDNWDFPKRRSRIWQAYSIMAIVGFGFGIGAFVIQLPNAIQQKQVMVEMRDGVKLNTFIYGKDLNEEKPTILIRTAYGSSLIGGRGITEWVDKGFHVVIQDCRGTPPAIPPFDNGHYSAGKFVPFRPEQEDGADTIDWIVDQKWSNNEIYLWGGSYLSYTALAAASSQSDDAIVKGVGVGIFGSGAYDAAYSNGIFIQNLPGAWILSMEECITLAELSLYDNYDPPLSDIPQRICPNNCDDLLWKELLEHNTPDEYWELDGKLRLINDIKVPIYSQLGYFDYFAWTGIKDWEAISQSSGPLGNSHMVLTPTGHMAGPETLYKVEPNARYDGMDAEVKFLCDLEKGKIPERSVSAYIIGSNKWLNATGWPIPGTDYQTQYLHSDGTLQSNTQSIGGNQSYIYDPATTLNYVTNSEDSIVWGTWEDHSLVTEQTDSLVYELPITGDGLTLCGQIDVTLNATTDCVDTDWFIEVLDYDPVAKTNMFLSHGMLRAMYRTWDSDRNLTKVTPNLSTLYKFQSWPIGAYFKPGHVLKLVIRSSKYPYFAKNSNGGNLYLDESWTIARNTIQSGPLESSRFVLPVVPNL